MNWYVGVRVCATVRNSAGQARSVVCSVWSVSEVQRPDACARMRVIAGGNRVIMICRTGNQPGLVQTPALPRLASRRRCSVVVARVGA